MVVNFGVQGEKYLMVSEASMRNFWCRSVASTICARLDRLCVHHNGSVFGDRGKISVGYVNCYFERSIFIVIQVYVDDVSYFFNQQLKPSRIHSVIALDEEFHFDSNNRNASDGMINDIGDQILSECMVLLKKNSEDYLNSKKKRDRVSKFYSNK